MPAERFRRFVLKFPCEKPQLPLVHTTKHEHFLSIASDGHILAKTRPGELLDPISGGSMVHLFYGRPSYDPTGDEKPTTDIKRLPVCFVLKADCIPVCSRIYPFDSGACDRGLFREHLGATLSKHDFCLGSSMDMPPRVVKAFFGSNREYYQGYVRSDLTIGFSHIEAKGYFDMIRAPGRLPPDDRRSAIEVQVTHDIVLGGNVLAVVLPTPAMDDPEISHYVLRVWNAHPLDYPHYLVMDPRQYKMAILNRLRQFLRRRRYL